MPQPILELDVCLPPQAMKAADIQQLAGRTFRLAIIKGYLARIAEHRFDLLS